MSRINIVIISVLVLWAYSGMSWTSLAEIQDYLEALGIALLMQPWVERQLE